MVFNLPGFAEDRVYPSLVSDAAFKVPGNALLVGLGKVRAKLSSLSVCSLRPLPPGVQPAGFRLFSIICLLIHLEMLPDGVSVCGSFCGQPT